MTEQSISCWRAGGTRLIEAANKLIHRQSFNQTTLADIARESQAPPGNGIGAASFLPIAQKSDVCLFI